MRKALLALLLCFVLLACANFTYRHYGLDVNSIDVTRGKLLGPTEDFDLPLSVCQSSNEAVSPCVVFKIEEFFKLRRDLIELKRRLEACEKSQI